MASIYLDLYQKRYIYDRNAQPNFSDHYTNIDNDLKNYYSKSDCHPYEIRPDTRFTNNKYYENGDPNWYKGILKPKDKFLYRIDNINKLLVYNRLNNVNKSNLRSKYSVNNFDINLLDQSEVPALFDKLTIRNNNWLPLNELLINYETPRGITWWTNKNISKFKNLSTLIENAHTLGLATNWLSNYLVIIRCNVQKMLKVKTLNDIKVPSIIDAFNSPIFLPQLEIKKPKHGVTINLNDIGSIGYKEYIIRDIDVSSLDIKSIKISDDLKKEFSYANETNELYQKILSLY